MKQKRIKLNNPIKQAGENRDLDLLEVNVYYDKGDYNTRRGIKMSVHPIRITDYNGVKMVSRIVLGDKKETGIYAHIKDLNRKSNKQIELVAERVFKHLEFIREHYEKEDFQTIQNLVHSIQASLV